MSSESFDNLLPAEVDAQLDQLLGQWRLRHQLDAARAQAVRQTIVESSVLPAVTPDAWLKQHLNYLDRVIRQANWASQDAANRSFRALNRQWPWLTLPEDSAASGHTWRPYLKLS